MPQEVKGKKNLLTTRTLLYAKALFICPTRGETSMIKYLPNAHYQLERMQLILQHIFIFHCISSAAFSHSNFRVSFFFLAHHLRMCLF